MASESTTENLSVAVVQLKENAGWDAVREALKDAANKGANLAVLPESSDYGWVNPAVFPGVAQSPDGYLGLLKNAAIENKLWIVAGFGERGGQTSESGVYTVFDSSAVVDSDGNVLAVQRQLSVMRAFDADLCPSLFKNNCSYSAADADAPLQLVHSPWGKISTVVCADMFVGSTLLNQVKALKPDYLFVPVAMPASQLSECNDENMSPVGKAKQSAEYAATNVVVANSAGDRNFGRFRPSVYCGTSGIVSSSGATLLQLPRDEPSVMTITFPSGDHANRDGL